jgi:membrane fusion protein, multidrug efflux system
MMARWIYRGLAVAGLALIAAGCGGSANSSSAANTAEGTARVVNVEVRTVEPETFAEFVNVTGTVQASRDVTVSAEESGIVREVLAERGRAVRAGQPIVRLDDRLLRAQFDQAQAEAALARETWERQRRLWEEDGIGSELGYLRARYGAETAAAQERALATRLERTVVRAPVSGMLDDRFVEVGTTVSAGAPVARVVDVSTVKVLAGVPERYAADIRPGGAVTVTFDHMPGQELRATAQYVGTALDEQNRTFPVEVAVGNPSGALKPGMIAKVQVGRRTVPDALLVPREAVLRAENGFIVYVVVEQADQLVAEARYVQTGTTAAGRVVIESGLQPGERVIVVGQQQVAGGDLLRIVNEQRMVPNE